MKKDGDRFWITLNGLTSGKEYIFQYLLDSNLLIADPYVEKISDPDNDVGIPNRIYPNLIKYPKGKTSEIAGVIQTGQTKFNWQVNNFSAPSKEKLIIYELLIRDFTSNKDIKTVNDSLGYLKTLGINAIELMPFNEFEGNDSWGYNPSFYFAPDKAYGTKNDYKNFIDECHKNGIAVIQDIVLNHSYGQSPFVRMYFQNGAPAANNPWYNVKSPNPVYFWGYDFNHKSLYTQKLIDSIASFWMSEYKIDGFRYDFTKGFTNTPGDGTAYDSARINILKRMSTAVWKRKQNAYVILEHFADNSEETVLANYGMMIWGNLNGAYAQAAMSYNDAGGSWDFSWINYSNRGWKQPNVVGYMESHDEERIAYKCETWGNKSVGYNIKNIPVMGQRLMLDNLFFILIPGPKMIWQFGELGYDSTINSSGGRVNDKTILWNYYFDPNRKNIYNMVRTLNELKLNEPLFSSSTFTMDASGKVKKMVFNGGSDKAFIVGNFDDTSLVANLTFPTSGTWYEMFHKDSVTLTGTSLSLTMQPGEYRMYSTKKISTNYVITSVNELNFNHKSQTFVFPNPFDNMLQIDIDKEVGSLAIYDIMGHLILQSTINSNKSLNTENIKPGIYLLNIRYRNGDFRAAKIMKL